jgi:hypothetical protein
MTGRLAGTLSFRRIAGIPFDAYMAALGTWRLTGHDGRLRLGKTPLRGPIKRDRHFGTCRIEVCLARGPLRPPVGCAWKSNPGRPPPPPSTSSRASGCGPTRATLPEAAA